MASKPHATTEEQTAQLGKVRRKPRYVDIFSGEVSDKLPKRGNGDHITLAHIEGERPAVPGMASWAGGGPDGKRCEHCQYLGAVTIQRPNGDKEGHAVACFKYCQRTGRLPPARDIRLERACDQFKEGRASAYHIDWAGEGRMSTLNLSDPAVKAAIKQQAEIIVAEKAALREEELDEVFGELVTIRDALETARRHLTSPEPRPAEATLYIERALEAVSRCA